MLRPADLYGLRRDDILLADEHLLGPFLLLRVREPTTRWRGGKQQNVRIDLEVVVDAFSTFLRRLPAHRLVWPMSPSRFARRLQHLSRAAMGNSISVLPSLLRTGGATCFFQSSGEALERLRWKGRWRDGRILSNYIQELTAPMLNTRFSDEDLRRVNELAVFFASCLVDLRINNGSSGDDL